MQIVLVKRKMKKMIYLDKKPRLIFYDFEVFSKARDPITSRAWWMIVLIEYESKKGKIIVNDLNMLKKYYNYFKNDIWVGFNSRNYDVHIFKGLLLGMDAGYINDKIIIEGKKGWQVVRDGYKIPLNNFDLMPNPPIGLKTLEGFMGSMIKESDIPFDLDRPLTKDEIKETIKYCLHDVKQTILVYEARTEEFESQLGLIEMFNLDMSLFNKTKAQLSAYILGAEKHKNRRDEFDFIFPETISLNKYKYIKEWYEDPENKCYTMEIEKIAKNGKKTKKVVKRQLKTEIAGIEHILGYGGIHSAKPNYVGEGIILCCDVSSLYPSIMINYNFLSRNVKDPFKFKEIRDTRLELKAIKDKKQKPLKIVINGTFGASKDEYNPLYDPLMANNVCIAGQLLLVDLIEKVEPYCELIQSNTDGIYMKVDNKETVQKIKNIATEWEKRTGLQLEWDEYVKIVQKDVNNYILIAEDGHYKSKGAYVKKLNDLDYDLPIVNKALINYFTKKIPVEETINNCNELREFQKLVKVSSLYLYGLHGDKHLNERVLRVFADKREDAQGVFKVKRKVNKEGIEVEVPEKIGNTPDKTFIDNDDIKGKTIPDYLDKTYYINLAHKRLNDFLGIKPEKKKKPKKKKEKVEKLIKLLDN